MKEKKINTKLLLNILTLALLSILPRNVSLPCVLSIFSRRLDTCHSCQFDKDSQPFLCQNNKLLLGHLFLVIASPDFSADHKFHTVGIFRSQLYGA